MRGDVAGSDAIVVDVDREARAGCCTPARIAVDMESHVVGARSPRRHGLPFAVFRVIADAAQRALAPAALVGMRADGTVDQLRRTCVRCCATRASCQP